MATGAGSEAFTSEDEALLERLAARVVELRMEIPAILALESGRPLGFIASQAMVFFEPIARALFPLPGYQRLTALAERRETVEKLIAKIEARADEAERARRSAAAQRRTASKPRP